MKTKYIFKAGIILSSMLILTACGSKKNAAYDETGAGYATISSVDGIIFNVPQTFTSKATAVTRIANDQEFTTDGIYSYSNGNDEYMFFCMDELIILANKGTDFNFSNTEIKESALASSSVIDSMCSKLGKKFNYTESTADGVYKIVADVSENVSITTELYGDYIGKLAVIEDGENEWSVLAGVKGTSLSSLSKEQLTVIDTVVGSMRATHGEYVIQDNAPDYDIVIGDTALTEAEKKAPSAEEEEAVEEVSMTPVEEEASLEGTTEESEDEVIFEEEFSEEAGVAASTPENEQTKEPDSEKEVVFEESKEVPTTETESEPVNELVGNTEPEEKVHTNQKERDLSEEKIYNSDIYSLLKVGNYGLTVSSSSDGEVDYPVIHLKEIYTGNDAVDIIKKQAASTTRYDYFEAPMGYSWQVAEYDVIYTGEFHEIDVRMLGVDGNTLKYRGVPAPQRTYYTDYEIEENIQEGTLKKVKVFYAVPNGCKEYVLKFGDGKVGTETEHYSAYYHIEM